MAARCITRSCTALTTSHSSARAFLQVVSRHHTPLPDFLLPSFSRPLSQLRTPPAHKAVKTTHGSRAFSSSAPRRQTVALANPRKDEDGKEMSIEITPRASNRLKQIMAKDANPLLALRITVESGGCHGFQYLMSLTTLEDSISKEDTVFGADGARVVMDEPSLELLKGSKIDFTMELIGSQFKIVDNPLATSSCGCGTSFDIKI